MRKQLYGIAHCQEHGLDPADVFSNHFVFSKDKLLSNGCFGQVSIGDWTFQYGEKTRFRLMRNRDGIAYGVFVGLGVDGVGRYVDEGSFDDFDPGSRSFWFALQSYINEIAGRYVVFATKGKEARCFFDPVAHMTTLYNSTLGVLASSVYLAIDRAPIKNSKFDCHGIRTENVEEGREPNFILGHSMDRDVKFVLPNHRLDLPDFKMVRIWPKDGSFQDASTDQFGRVLDEMVARQTQILDAILDNEPCILPVSGGADSRKLLACLSHRLNDLKSIFAFQHTSYAQDDCDAGEYVSSLVGARFSRFTASDAKIRFPLTRRQQQHRNALFWLRSSDVAWPTKEYRKRCYLMPPKDTVHLRGNVMDLTRAVWWGRWDARRMLIKPGLKYEIGNLFLMASPSVDIVADWAEEYLTWKQGLPKNAQRLVHDFIFLELFLHVSSAKYYAYPDYFYVNPFSDRRLIELTLCLPLDFRFGTTVNEEFLKRAEPRLANQPYRNGVRRLIRVGEWQPLSQSELPPKT